jgi:hypothetical protein
MAKGNFNNQTKRKRELKKKDKRAAKDEKRAQRKAVAREARAAAAGDAIPSISANASVVRPLATSNVSSPSSAVSRWMNKTPSEQRSVTRRR